MQVLGVTVTDICSGLGVVPALTNVAAGVSTQISEDNFLDCTQGGAASGDVTTAAGKTGLMLLPSGEVLSAS